MNLFLHSFESAYASLSLFAFAGLFYAVAAKAKPGVSVPRTKHA